MMNGLGKRQKLSTYKHHVIILCGLISLFVVLMFTTGCQKNIEIEAAVEEPIIIEESPDYNAVLWVDGSNHLYQPLFPEKTKLTSLSDERVFRGRQVFMTELGLAFRYADTDVEGITYTIYDEESIELIHDEIIPTYDQETKDLIFRIGTEGISHSLYNGHQYVIEVYIHSLDIRYYLQTVYTSIDGNEIGINKSYNMLKEYLKEQEISFMHEPFIYVKAESSYQGQVEYRFVGAKREEDGFTNYDYIYTYQVNLEAMDIQLMSYNQMPKQRNYYDKEKGGWILGDSILKRQLISSQNGRFEVYYTASEMVLYDVTTEQLYEVYRLDSLDSDYIYDEYMDHELQVVEVTNQGDITFSVIGYIHDSYTYSERRGIGHYSYTIEDGLSVIGFFESGESIESLLSYIKEKSYYYQQERLLYIFENYMLYRLDLETGTLEFMETYLGGEFNQHEGLITWQGLQGKYNGAIYVIDLKTDDAKVHNLYKTGVNQHLLGVTNNRLIVGRYNIEETYEKLNGETIYPYTEISIFTPEGDIEISYKAGDKGTEYYLGAAFYDMTTGEWSADYIKKNISISSRYENSRVDYVSTDERLILMEETETMSNSYNKTSHLYAEATVTEEDMLRVVSQKEVAIEFTPNPYVQSSKPNIYRFYNTPPISSYVVTDVYGNMSYVRSFEEALKLSEEMPNYTIKHIIIDYLKDDKTGETIRQYEYVELFDSTWLKDSQYLDDVIIIPQRPELPRGCEVTSLSILLNYYMDNAPDKMSLAEQLKVTNLEHIIKDGFVHYADMHVEFAGSMSDVNQPGLGVYIEPVRDLANDYVGSQALDVSGLSFEQLLTYVSSGTPALVIIPNRYQAVPDYALQVWKTPNGYMEVTYQEHSVVVMGYDENYIYYSDPSKGIIDKKSRNDFKKAWESIGKQALIILEK